MLMPCYAMLCRHGIELHYSHDHPYLLLRITNHPHSSNLLWWPPPDRLTSRIWYNQPLHFVFPLYFSQPGFFFSPSLSISRFLSLCCPWYDTRVGNLPVQDLLHTFLASPTEGLSIHERVKYVCMQFTPAKVYPPPPLPFFFFFLPSPLHELGVFILRIVGFGEKVWSR
jgi:hypothetical protein